MSVLIEENTQAHLELDLQQELDLLSLPGIAEAVLAFSVVRRTPKYLVLDVGEELTAALEFLCSAIMSTGRTVRLSNDLERLLERQKQEKLLIQRVKDTPSQEDLLASVSLPEQIPGFQNPSIQNLLFHQVRGLKLALAIENLAEFSVQGAGKTAIALAAFCIWNARGNVNKALVIGPVSSHRPWEDEIQRCMGSSYVPLRWSGSALQRTRLIPLFNESTFILCTYDTAIRDQQMLSRLLRSNRVLLILDESHYIKNFTGGARASVAIKLANFASKRMILTGTPAPHSLFDLWNQIAFLWPSSINILVGNRLRYQDLLEQSKQPARVLRHRLNRFFHRTTQSELNLPQPVTTFLYLSANQVPLQQTKIVKLLEMRIMAEAKKLLVEKVDREVLAHWRRARIIRLLQAVSNPGLLVNKGEWWSKEVGDVDMSDLMTDVRHFYDGSLLSGKISWTVTQARDLIRQGKKVLIWTWWIENLKLLNRLLSDLNPLLLYGEIKPYQEDWDDPEEISRERNIMEFRTRLDRPVLIANPSACAESISLHRECHDAIYVDRTFNCGQFLQSLNRIHRVGLPPGTLTQYWIPMLDCAVERSVDTRLKQRQHTMFDFLNDNSPVVSYIANEESSVAEDNSEMEKDFAMIESETEKS